MQMMEDKVYGNMSSFLAQKLSKFLLFPRHEKPISKGDDDVNSLHRRIAFAEEDELNQGAWQL